MKDILEALTRQAELDLLQDAIAESNREVEFQAFLSRLADIEEEHGFPMPAIVVAGPMEMQ